MKTPQTIGPWTQNPWHGVASFIQRLEDTFPQWRFELYGKSTSMVAAFPPQGISFAAWNEIQPHAVVWAVCGPFYVLCAK